MYAIVAAIDFAQVVRGDVRRHSDRDPGAAVDEQVRESRRQHHRLGPTAVVGRHEVDGVRVEITQHLGREPVEARLGVVTDEAVGEERVVVGINPDRVDGLNPGVLDRSDLGVVVVARDQRLDHASYFG